MTQEEINKQYQELCNTYGNLAISLKRISAQMDAVEHQMVALDQLVPQLLKSSQTASKGLKSSGATNE